MSSSFICSSLPRSFPLPWPTVHPIVKATPCALPKVLKESCSRETKAIFNHNFHDMTVLGGDLQPSSIQEILSTTKKKQEVKKAALFFEFPLGNSHLQAAHPCQGHQVVHDRGNPGGDVIWSSPYTRSRVYTPEIYIVYIHIL